MATIQQLRAVTPFGDSIGVDESNKVIKGYIVAQTGPFKSGRGVFTRDSLAAIVKLMLAQPEGVKVRYGHPDGGTTAALDSFVGWAKNPRLTNDVVRADLYLSPLAFVSTNGGMSRGDYLLMRAELEPDSLNSSLALETDMQYTDVNSPPVWIPTAIIASDIVDDGDAVHGGLLAAHPKVEELWLRREWSAKKARLSRSPAEIELRRVIRNRKLLSERNALK